MPIAKYPPKATRPKRPKLPPEVRAYFELTGSLGGYARAKNMSPEARQASAKKAGLAAKAKRDAQKAERA